MQNSKPEVVVALGRALDPDRVFFVAPDDEAELPCISYMELNNVPAEDADDEEYTQLEEFAIDIWGETTPEEVSAIALAVNAEMVLLGFVRRHTPDIPPKDGTYHKNMIYERVI